ncbi:hypothetical protein EKN06_08560 [Croceicoccus ponticola]|uniref:Uncharacterized protein n=1 Tax=Croceicoccus ponticola TaxID=2217664 RepID=A0A437GX64_9SPHN|nr:hypothetical protein [Croceicoccus ponticola]RVQ66987.1 hypothetical protein EKN06_08560 [Croceicoccus ponticola]
MPALALVVLGGCGPEPEPQATAFAQEEQPLADIYVARHASVPLGPDGKPAPARMALFHGHYAVANGCLVFDMGGEQPALVRFAQDTPITVFGDRVVIAGTAHAFADKEQRGGGFEGPDAYDLLVERPPQRCPYSVIGP